MKRASGFLGLLGFGGMLLLIGGSLAQGPATPPPAAAPAAAPPTGRPTIAVFNMAAVMRDYGKAKFEVYKLNKRREELSKDLVVWQAEIKRLQNEAQINQVKEVRDKMQKDIIDLTRKSQDKSEELNKILNDEATGIISTLYDEIKTVVDKTAEMNGYHIVFAYPDAVTKEELNSAMVKELKLKPPAAQPFYVARHVDLTGVIVDTLNKWYPAPPVPSATPAVGAAPGTPGVPPAAPPAPPK